MFSLMLLLLLILVMPFLAHGFYVMNMLLLLAIQWLQTMIFFLLMLPSSSIVPSCDVPLACDFRHACFIFACM